jgi:hypothetical protein
MQSGVVEALLEVLREYRITGTGLSSTVCRAADAVSSLVCSESSCSMQGGEGQGRRGRKGAGE